MYNLHVAICYIQDFTSFTYSVQNLCQVLSENKHNDVDVYFYSWHRICRGIKKNTDMETTVKATKK